MSQTDKPATPSPEEKLLEDGLLGHLTDLRNSVVKAVLAVGVAFFALFPFNERIYNWFARPLLEQLPAGGEMIATGIISPFIVPLKVTLLVAFCLTLPYVLYQIWRFVAPGLYRREKRLVLPIVVSSTVLFYAGMAFAYFLLLKIVFGFIVSFAPSSIEFMPDVQNYLSFALTLFVVFGIAFEMPVAVFILVRAGVVEIATLRSARTYVIAGSFVVAAIVTPPDVLSQFMLAVPVWLLYEAGILFASLFPSAKEGEEKAAEEAG